MNAQVRKYIGIGESVMSEKEPPGISKGDAKLQAIRNAQEQAGVFLASLTEVKNSIITKDEITAFTAGVVKVGEVKYELIPLNDTLGIGKYRATAEVTIDTDDLNAQIEAWRKRATQKRANITNQNNELVKQIEELKRRNEELETMATGSDAVNKRDEIAKKQREKDKKTLIAQKWDEANRLYEQGKYNEAVKLCNEVIALDPNYDKAYYIRGIAYDDLNDSDRAIADYTKAIALDPNFAVAYYNRGRAYDDLKDYNSAIADYTKAIALDPNYAAAYNNRGSAYLNLKKYTRTLVDYTKAIALNPNYAEAYYNRGIAYASLKDYTGAIDDYTTAIALDPNFAMAYYERGLSYKAIGKVTKALADFRVKYSLDRG